MKTIGLGCYIEYGKCDYDNWDMEAEISDEDYALLLDVMDGVKEFQTDDIPQEEKPKIQHIINDLYEQMDISCSEDMINCSWDLIGEDVEDSIEKGYIKDKYEWRASDRYILGLESITL